MRTLGFSLGLVSMAAVACGNSAGGDRNGEGALGRGGGVGLTPGARGNGGAANAAGPAGGGAAAVTPPTGGTSGAGNSAQPGAGGGAAGSPPSADPPGTVTLTTDSFALQPGEE